MATSQPEIFNTDQGSQFTSLDFIRRLEDRGVQISLDGRGRVFDDIFVERLPEAPGYSTPSQIYVKEQTTLNPVQVLTMH